MNFGQWMQAHRRSLLFVIGLLAVAGALTAFRLPISLFPNVAFPRAVVSLDDWVTFIAHLRVRSVHAAHR